MRRIFSNPKINAALVFMSVAIAVFYYLKSQKNAEARSIPNAKPNLFPQGIPTSLMPEHAMPANEFEMSTTSLEKESAGRKKAQEKIARRLAEAADPQEQQDDTAAAPAAPLSPTKEKSIAAWTDTAIEPDILEKSALPTAAAAAAQFEASPSSLTLDGSQAGNNTMIHTRHSSTASEASTQTMLTMQSFGSSPIAAAPAASPASPASPATGWNLRNLFSYFRSGQPVVVAPAPANQPQP